MSADERLYTNFAWPYGIGVEEKVASVGVEERVAT